MSLATSVQLAVYKVPENVKQNVGAFLGSFANTNGQFNTNYNSVAPSGVYPVSLPSGNKVVVISVSAPISLAITFAHNAEVITQTITSLFMTDMEISDLEFNNSGSSAVDVVIING